MATEVAYLGPKGTYAEKAAHALISLEKLDQPKLLPLASIRAVIENLSNNQCKAAVVPIENSVEGGVTATMDGLWSNSNLFIKRAIVLPIKHALIGNTSINDISEVLSHPQALAQCSDWLNKNMPGALQLPTNSTAEAVRMIQGSKFRAAIGSQSSSNIQGLKILSYPINDIAGNCTRFVLLSNKKSLQKGNIASFAFSLRSNAPGALLEALSHISKLGMNMSRIESRPLKRELGEYIFFIDIENIQNTPETTDKLEKLLHPLCENIIHFGTYPSSELDPE